MYVSAHVPVVIVRPPGLGGDDASVISAISSLRCGSSSKSRSGKRRPVGEPLSAPPSPLRPEEEDDDDDVYPPEA